MLTGIADAGNTRIKAALFDGDKLVQQAYFTAFDADFARFYTAAGLHTILLGTVIPFEPASLQNTHLTVKLLSEMPSLPVHNAYLTPYTLGHDRLANACGAYALNHNRGPVLSIDMGTCIKYDLVNDKGQYLGGAIAPGLSMRFKALHHFTQKLPLVEPKSIPQIVGQNSVQSIESGVIQGIIAELNGMVAGYTAQHPGLKVFLTGGDAPFFSGSLKNNIFAIPFLTLHGLNAIARLNGLTA